MEVAISNIHCSTAKITVDGSPHTVCYWGEPTKKIMWVVCDETNKSYDMHGYHAPVSHLLPLFQVMCDLNAYLFMHHEDEH